MLEGNISWRVILFETYLPSPPPSLFIASSFLYLMILSLKLFWLQLSFQIPSSSPLILRLERSEGQSLVRAAFSLPLPLWLSGSLQTWGRSDGEVVPSQVKLKEQRGLNVYPVGKESLSLFLFIRDPFKFIVTGFFSLTFRRYEIPFPLFAGTASKLETSFHAITYSIPHYIIGSHKHKYMHRDMMMKNHVEGRRKVMLVYFNYC